MAIRANELRIGNWVNWAKEPVQITELMDGICNTTKAHLCYYKYIDPIPLSEDILLKSGFVVEYKSEWTIKYTYKSDERFGYDWNKTFDWRMRFLGEHFQHIKHLHQVQNIIYSLTGEELKIEL